MGGGYAMAAAKGGTWAGDGDQGLWGTAGDEGVRNSRGCV